MPTPRLHISIANEVNKHFNYDNDQVLIGSILPDQTTTDHIISHYQKDIDGIAGAANANKFLKDKHLPLDIKVGYIIHLLTDSYFNIFVFNNHCVFEKDTMIGYRKRNRIIKSDSDKVKEMKHKDSYTYEAYLLFNNKLPSIKNISSIDKIKDFNNIKFNKESLKNCINVLNRDVNKDYKIRRLLFFPRYYLISKREMNLFYNSCIKYIIGYLEKNKKEL